MTNIDGTPRTLLLAVVALAIAACGSDKSESPSVADAGETEVEDAARNLDDTMQGDAAVAPDADASGSEPAAGATTAPEPAEASPDDDGNPCTLTITAGDTIAYGSNSMSVPSSCSEVTVTLTHTGQLPASAMGHNWVLVPSGTADEIGMAGMSAGLDGNYLPAGDDRIVAATKIIGGGESDSVTFALSDLADGTEYVYVCTFPGHWSLMKGTFTVTG